MGFFYRCEQEKDTVVSEWTRLSGEVERLNGETLLLKQEGLKWQVVGEA